MFWLFWLSIAFFAYTFAGYSMLLWILSKFRVNKHDRANFWPTVSIIIPAYNEGHLIEAKIKNTLDLRYPGDRREIIVVSDCSQDATDEIARSFASQGVKLVRLPERGGKHHAQMVARDASSGEILLFTDASVELDPDALSNIVSNFADPSIGCVSSIDSVPLTGKVGTAEQLYVQLEMRLRLLEEQVGSLVGASGSCFAARREVCLAWNSGQSSDFFIPLQAYAAGMRTIGDPTCQARYATVSTASAELHRKVRTIVHGLAVLFEHRALLNPFRYGFFSVQLVSHKLFRWLVPFAALCLLISNCFLWRTGAFYRVLLASQLAFYAVGALSLASGRLVRSAAVRAVGFFVLGNAATVIAWGYFLLGEKFVKWQPSRRS